MPSGSYAECVAALPRLFVGTLQGVASVINAMWNALQREATARGHQLPPWRTREALSTNWLPPRFTDDVIAPPGKALHPVLLHTSHTARPRPAGSQCSASGPVGPPMPAPAESAGPPPGTATTALGVALDSNACCTRATSLPRPVPYNERHDPMVLDAMPERDLYRSPLAAAPPAPWCIVVQGFSTPGGISTNIGYADSNPRSDVILRPSGAGQVSTAADGTACSSTYYISRGGSSDNSSDGDSGSVSLFATGNSVRVGWAAASCVPGLTLGRERTPDASQSGSTGISLCRQSKPPVAKRVSSLTLSLTAADVTGQKVVQAQKHSVQGVVRRTSAAPRPPQVPQGSGSRADAPRTVAVTGLAQFPAKRVGSPSSPGEECRKAQGAEGVKGAIKSKHPSSNLPASGEPAPKHHKQQQPGVGNMTEPGLGCASAAAARTPALCVKWDAMPRIITVRPVGAPRLVAA